MRYGSPECPQCGDGACLTHSREMPYGRRLRYWCRRGHRFTLYRDNFGAISDKPPVGARPKKRDRSRPKREAVHYVREKLPRHRVAALLAEATTPRVREYLMNFYLGGLHG